MSDKPAPKRELINIATLADGRKVYAVFCPGCGVDLSKICLGRIRHTPVGDVADVWHQLRCPDCGYYLLEVPAAPKITPVRPLMWED